MDRVPHENVLAAFPKTVTVGNVALKPLTLGGVIRLAERGIGDLSARVPRDRVLAAAFTLSGEEDWQRFLRRARVGLDELSSAVETVLNAAFETFVRPAASKADAAHPHPTPHGLGWPLEYAEFLCSEYGWPFREAVDTPVATVYALMAACRQRHGGHHAGLDYLERLYAKDLKDGRTSAKITIT